MNIINFLLCTFIALASWSFCDELVELGHDLDSSSLVWPNPDAEQFKLIKLHEGNKEYGWYSSFGFSGHEHTGTHVDAPYHFDENGLTVDQIPANHLLAPAVVIDIEAKVKSEGPSASLTADDVVNWVNEHGVFPNNSIILVRTGWSIYYEQQNATAYFGKQGDSLNFPGISLSAAQTLLGYKRVSGISIVGVGIDTASLDMGTSKAFEVHRVLSKDNIFGIENLVNLDKIPAVGSELIVMPMKIRGGSGAPCRVFAKFDSNFSFRIHGNAALMFLTFFFVFHI